MRMARSAACWTLKLPEISVEPVIRPPHGHLHLGRGDDLVVEDDRDAALVALGARGRGRELAELAGPVAVELHDDHPVDAVGALRRLGAGDVLALEGHRPELEEAALVDVGQDDVALGGGLGVGRGDRPDDRVHGQLRRTPDRLDRLARVLHVGQLDDDPVVAGAGERRLRDAQRVDPAAEHLDGAVGRLGVGLDAVGRARLQGDLGAAAQVETETGLLGQGEGGTATEQPQHQQETEPHAARHAVHPPPAGEAPKTRSLSRAWSG